MDSFFIALNIHDWNDLNEEISLDEDSDDWSDFGELLD